MSKTVLFQTIQFSIRLVQFDRLIGPYQVLPLHARVDLEAMVVKGYYAFPKAPAFLEPYHKIDSLRESNPSTEKLSAYSTAPAD